MNELTVLMQLLSKKISKSQIGATKQEILKNLNVKDKNKSMRKKFNLKSCIESL